MQLNEYSPKGCIFVPKEINLYFRKDCIIKSPEAIANDLFQVRLTKFRESEIVLPNTFNTELEAKLFYIDEKMKDISFLVNCYKNLLPILVINAIKNYRITLSDF